MPHLRASSPAVSPGSQTQLFCDPGFYLVGEPLLQCHNKGEWSHALPRCEREGPLVTHAQTLTLYTHTSTYKHRDRHTQTYSHTHTAPYLLAPLLIVYQYSLVGLGGKVFLWGWCISLVVAALVLKSVSLGSVYQRCGGSPASEPTH